MLITTEVTEKDYRALQWSVLMDRSKLQWAFVCGMLLLSCLVLQWRTRNGLWVAGLYLVPMFLKDVCGVSGRESPNDHFFQWFCLSYLVASLPVLLFPKFFRRLALLPEAPAGPHLQA